MELLKGLIYAVVDVMELECITAFAVFDLSWLSIKKCIKT